MRLSIIIYSLLLTFFILMPLSIKWELNKKITIPAIFVIGLFNGIVVNVILLFWNFSFYSMLVIEIIFIGIISISLLLWRFFRDPERVPPEDDNVILAAADGEIIYIKKIEKGEVPFADKQGRKYSLKDFIQSDVLPQGGFQVGISMTYLDVHVNRAPISGKVTLLKYINGLFLSLKKKEAIIQNERTLIVIDNDKFKVGIVQIASRLVRKIIPYIRENQEVQKGDRIGMICFGSQVDMILPIAENLQIQVKPGQKVKAGVTIIAKYSNINEHL